MLSCAHDALIRVLGTSAPRPARGDNSCSVYCADLYSSRTDHFVVIWKQALLHGPCLGLVLYLRTICDLVLIVTENIVVKSRVEMPREMSGCRCRRDGGVSSMERK